MKILDVLAAVLLVIGGINWGLYGLFDTDLVAAIGGQTLLATTIYALVGAAALYQVLALGPIRRRWNAAPVFND